MVQPGLGGKKIWHLGGARLCRTVQPGRSRGNAWGKGIQGSSRKLGTTMCKEGGGLFCRLEAER